MARVKIVFGDSILYVSPSQVSVLQAKIKARQEHDEKINKELRGMLPSSRTNQFASWISQKKKLTWESVKELGMTY